MRKKLKAGGERKSQSAESLRIKTEKRELVYYNCGDKGENLLNVAIKCFKCNQFGRISKDSLIGRDLMRTPATFWQIIT